MKQRRGPAPGDWERWREFRTGPKLPPPEHGIKVKKLGSTWWGQRWMEALEHVLGGDAKRLSRGRSYARAGRTHDLSVRAGKVEALVTGSRPAPYTVNVELSQLSDAVWQHAIESMAQRAQFSAELLGGEMPQAIDEAFRAAGSSLFPEQRADLATRCSCPDWGDPCKHVAATHYVLGEAFDRDPFLLFELRGRSKAQVLDALRQARAGTGNAPRGARAETPQGLEAPRGRLWIDGANYDRSSSPLPALQFSFEAPSQHGAVLRQLGMPAAWGGESSPADELACVVQRAADTARRIALAEDSAGATDVGEDAPSSRPPKPLVRKPAGKKKARARRIRRAR